MDYIGHLRKDAARLSEAARAAGPTAPVPTCPDWDVTGLIDHVAAVYEHKIACMRLGRRPEESEWATQPPDGGDHVAWFESALERLVAELESRGPAAPSYTWYPPDQTAGFWFRRMAQETAVHRVDAEAAAGWPSTIDDDLALDGVDEMLVAFLCGPWWDKDPVPEATGGTYAVRSGDRTWRLTLEPVAVRVSTDPGPVEGEIAGAPYDALMWVWGRPSAATTTGDVKELDARLQLLRD